MKLTDLFSDPGMILFILFCTMSAIQIFYYIYFFSGLAWYKKKEKKSSQTHPVSVIVCARDEERNLTQNLPSILQQQYATSHEVIVVNDNSFDQSTYLLEQFRKEFKHMNPVELTQESQHIPGKKFPLSIGIKTARYEIVLLTDADCVPASEKWIEKMQEGYSEDTEIVLGYGPLNKRPGFLNKFIRWETFHTALQYLSYSLRGKTYMGVGRNLSYKKTVFFRNKGFSAHNHIPGGDDDLFINKVSSKTNTAIVIDPDTFCYSDAPANAAQWRHQKNRHYSTSKYYKPAYKVLLGLYSFSQFLYYPLLIAALLFYHWEYALGVFLVRFILQAIIFYRTMDKLKEKDLFAWFLVFDVGMFFYYLYFARSLFKKNPSRW